MTGPRDLLPLAAELPTLPEVPIAPAAGARVVQAENGRLIYVDPTDMRGAALVKARGNLKPVAMTMWRQLVAERRWTHILDVGANYGEMLVGIDIPDGARLIAVEPNPHVGWHLERTLQGAGLRVEVVRKAISDGARTVDMTVNRTWSGMTAISVDRTNTIGHRMEPIRVDAITLADLLESESDRTAMAVLVKIDVEGHEVNALKGLAGIERDFGAFAALVEITQLTAEDLDWLCTHYTVDFLETASGQLSRAPIGSASEVSQLLSRGDHHVNDVVLRLR
jgi:FkbM family methyltransferase